eukprot:gene18362-biopygen1523
MTSEECNLIAFGTFKRQGFTADGRPWYKASVTSGFALGAVVNVAYLYYDRDCDGKAGNSANDYPQWASSEVEPDPAKLEDLDGTGKCVGDQDTAGSYSMKEDYDLTPTIGKIMANCPDLFNDPTFALQTITGGLVGCAHPYPDHTYSWTDWGSTDGSECGEGEEVRTEVEFCTNVDPECPCMNRRNPETLKEETRKQRACKTTTSTTS